MPGAEGRGVNHINQEANYRGVNFLQEKRGNGSAELPTNRSVISPAVKSQVPRGMKGNWGWGRAGAEGIPGRATACVKLWRSEITWHMLELLVFQCTWSTECDGQRQETMLNVWAEQTGLKLFDGGNGI